MEDFIISVSENQKVKIERENLHHGEKKDVYIPVNSFLENESPNYEDFLFSYDFVVKEKWKKQKGLENHRLLTSAEWKYIFSRESSFLHTKINNVNGVILLPDNVRLSDYIAKKDIPAMAQECPISLRKELESIGSIFLRGANVYGNHLEGYALRLENPKCEKSQIQIGNWIFPLFSPADRKDRFLVRLVKDVLE